METSEYPTPQVKKAPETKGDKPDFTAAAKTGDPTITGVPLPPEYQTLGPSYVNPDTLGPNQRPTEIQWQDEMTHQGIQSESPFPPKPIIDLTRPQDREDHKVLRFPDGKVIG